MSFFRTHKVSLPILYMCLGIFLSLLGTWFFARGTIVAAYEQAWISVFPSAALAVGFADRHFNSRMSASYDIDRAAYFYGIAEELDPSYPYVFHQLARIEFLKGDFYTALYYINKEIELHGETESNTYYVRGLIEGYMGDYASAAKDYERYLEFDPNNWAGLNDYAWVLLKAGRFEDAEVATQKGLAYFPENPWLLNNYSISLYEQGRTEEAYAAVVRAVRAANNVTEEEWLRAYPGNDPKVAGEGVVALRKAAADNMRAILAAAENSPN